MACLGQSSVSCASKQSQMSQNMRGATMRAPGILMPFLWRKMRYSNPGMWFTEFVLYFIVMEPAQGQTKKYEKKCLLITAPIKECIAEWPREVSFGRASVSILSSYFYTSNICLAFGAKTKELYVNKGGFN